MPIKISELALLVAMAESATNNYPHRKKSRELKPGIPPAERRKRKAKRKQAKKSRKK